MNKRSALLVLLVALLMAGALAGLPLLADGIAREEMAYPVVETCTPVPAPEMDENGNYMGRETVFERGRFGAQSAPFRALPPKDATLIGRRMHDDG